MLRIRLASLGLKLMLDGNIGIANKKEVGRKAGGMNFLEIWINLIAIRMAYNSADMIDGNLCRENDCSFDSV